MTWNLFSGGLLNAIYVLYLSHELQLAPSQVATLFVTSGLAGVVGALVWPRFVAPRLGIGPSLILADTLSVLGTLCVPLVQGSPEQVVELRVANHWLCHAYSLRRRRHAAPDIQVRPS